MRGRSCSYSPPPRDYGRRHRSPSPRSRSRGYSRDLPTSLLVRNLRHDCRVEDLREPFGQFGRLKDVYLPRNYYTGEPRGFGFVQYLDPADAADAKHHMDGYVLLGRELTVVFAEENRKKPSEMRQRQRGRASRFRSLEEVYSYYCPMDKGKKPLETVGNWTTIKKKPNKGNSPGPVYPKQGFVHVPPRPIYYPNQGYYIPYTNRPTQQVVITPSVNQLQWAQDPNSAYQISYAEVIKKTEDLLKTQQVKDQILEVKNFYNPGLNENIYNLINDIWKNHIMNQKTNFRRALTKLSQTLVETTTKDEIADKLLLNSIIYHDWDYLEIGFLAIEEITNLLETCQYLFGKNIRNPVLEKTFRLCLYYKSKIIVPQELFLQIDKIIYNQQNLFKDKFSENFLQSYVYTNIIGEQYPVIKFRLDHEPFDIKSIEMGFVHEIVVQNLSFHLLKDFPAFIKSKLYSFTKEDDFYYYIRLSITSLIGIAEREIFYQPYQIWTFTKSIGIPSLRAVSEDKEKLQSSINNNYQRWTNYIIQSGLELQINAHNILDDEHTSCLTDGRRIFVTQRYGLCAQSGEERQPEAIQLLQKIANMTIEGYPGTILENINKLYLEGWNSPPNSPQSMHLDEIEETNLQNVQEG